MRNYFIIQENELLSRYSFTPVICGGLIGYRTGTIAKEKYGRSALQRMDRQYAYQGTGDLKQPPGKPPAALFGPVWTTIYGLTGLASYLARSNPAARMLYISSLLFNFGRIDIAGGEHLLIAAAWTPLFFGNNRPGYALFDIVALWANIALLIPQWNKVDKRAGAIGAGYLAWVSFATYLNSGVWYLNYSGTAKVSNDKAQ